MKIIKSTEKIIKGQYLFLREIFDTSSQKNVIVETSQGYAYKILLEYDKLNNIISAKYLYYDDNPVDYNGEVIFEFEGEQQTVQAVNGVAEIPFVVVDSGTYVVRTANPDVENGEVTINA